MGRLDTKKTASIPIFVLVRDLLLTTLTAQFRLATVLGPPFSTRVTLSMGALSAPLYNAVLKVTRVENGGLITVAEFARLKSSIILNIFYLNSFL